MYDVVVIGSGPGGYVAAIKAAQLGKRVALIEKGLLGGTCLNVGCIPTKTLIANADVLHKIKHAAEFGLEVGPVKIDYAKMKERKDKVVAKIRTGLEGLINSNKITIVRGEAKFLSSFELQVSGQSAPLQAKRIIIATGSEPLEIPAFPTDGHTVLNSTSILEMTHLPRSLIIIGGGYIGCEFASLYAELGVKVTIVEALPSILALQGAAVSGAITRAFKAAGMEILTSAKVQSVKGGSVTLEGGQHLEAEAVLIAIGRKICTDHIGLSKAGVKVGERGAIEVNGRMETNVPGIYAIGDATGRFMLAHVASHQGIAAAVNACGGEAHMHYEAVPAVIFTHPEVAMVGLSEEMAKERNQLYKVGTFPFSALGKAVAAHETTGFAQILSDPKTGQILGALVIGEGAASLIAEMALAIHNELTLDSVMDTIHAHPTLPESWLEAALLANDTPIHFPPKRK